MYCDDVSFYSWFIFIFAVTLQGYNLSQHYQQNMKKNKYEADLFE